MQLDELAQKFLEENHACIMVTVRADGTAHVARVNCGLVDGKLWSSGTKNRVRTKHLRTNPHATLCIFARDRRWIGIEATVTIHEGPDAPHKALTLQRAQGREPEDVAAFLEDMAAQERIIYEFELERVYGSFEEAAPDFILAADDRAAAGRQLMPKDLRSFIAEVAEKRPDQIKTISEGVDPRFGVTAVAAKLEKQGQFPALYFKSVGDTELPAIVGLTATYDRLALALGTDVQHMVPHYAEKQAHPIPPQVVQDAPVKEVIWTGPDADLTRLPIPTHNALDGGPYLTGAMLVARDPGTGVMNVGLYRHQVLGPDRLGVWFITSHHGGYIQQAYEELNQPMPVAIAIGHHPAAVMGAISRIPGMGGEYDEAGGLLGEPLELVQCETSDLMVPARAEIIIEGVIEPGARAEEGPFAEWPGMYTEHGPKPVITVKAITMRRDAIFYDVFAGHREHQVLGSLPRMGSIFRRVKQVVPGVKAVNVPAHVRMHCYISFTKKNETEVKKAAMQALLTEPENLNMIVLVDDDIDVFNEQEVMWAVGTRFNADKDLHVIPEWAGPGGLIPTQYDYFPDGTKTPRMMGAMILDATKPLPPAQFPPRAQVPDEALAAVDLERMLKPFTGLRAPTAAR